MQKLTDTGRYSEIQLEEVRKLLDEEDRLIQEALQGEKGREILLQIQGIRKRYGERVEKILKDSGEASKDG